MKVVRKSLISGFIFLNLLVMVMSSLPDKSAVTQKIMQPVYRYQRFFGLNQAWRMFAPNPSRANSYLEATLNFTDGSSEKWTFPRASQMSEWDRFISGERFRKYQQEHLRPLQKPELWKDLAEFLVRETGKVEKQGQKRTLERVVFNRSSNVILAPSKEWIPHGQKSTNYKTEEVYSYVVNERSMYETKNDHKLSK